MQIVRQRTAGDGLIAALATVLSVSYEDGAAPIGFELRDGVSVEVDNTASRSARLSSSYLAPGLPRCGCHPRFTQRNFHIIATYASPSAEGSANRRMRLWVDGSEITSFATDTNPGLNAQKSSLNNSAAVRIGQTTGAGDPIGNNALLDEVALFDNNLPAVARCWHRQAEGLDRPFLRDHRVLAPLRRRHSRHGGE